MEASYMIDVPNRNAQWENPYNSFVLVSATFFIIEFMIMWYKNQISLETCIYGLVFQNI